MWQWQQNHRILIQMMTNTFYLVAKSPKTQTSRMNFSVPFIMIWISVLSKFYFAYRQVSRMKSGVKVRYSCLCILLIISLLCKASHFDIIQAIYFYLSWLCMCNLKNCFLYWCPEWCVSHRLSSSIFIVLGLKVRFLTHFEWIFV